MFSIENHVSLHVYYEKRTFSEKSTESEVRRVTMIDAKNHRNFREYEIGLPPTIFFSSTNFCMIFDGKYIRSVISNWNSFVLCGWSSGWTPFISIASNVCYNQNRMHVQMSFQQETYFAYRKVDSIHLQPDKFSFPSTKKKNREKEEEERTRP